MVATLSSPLRSTLRTGAWAIAISVCLLFPLASQAAKAAPKARQNTTSVTLPHSQHARQKLQHDQRKQAARRLRTAFAQAQAQKIAHQVKTKGRFGRAK